ncbi:hypothetical protein ACH5RR_017126 [Cinchona calisaya]|uniref:C2H2-type domain-containing protein n=1 Tax=Cinchona calisaya TaxID=153742 RepID=A0ABD2ZXZ1_9GENT
MSVAKLSAGGTLDSMKSGDGNEPIDTSARQTVGKEPQLSFSRTGESPVQWIQLLNALDQQELPGWPLLTPLKVQMQKCEKCSREFCSLVNYRRHIRVHRRSLNVDKESHKIRDMLAVFWDKLSLEDAKEVVSFRDVILKEIPGSSVIKALAASLHKPVVWTLPQVYVKAGSTLLDIIHGKPSRLPISSLELFSILDDASERTFLCAGTAESVQKYVFDGEAGKVALDMKNLVASTGFLVEQKLVKAWLADKDIEALRCQKLLVEEEEAAQKRQAELLERKRQKKLRQKEQKAREQLNGVKEDLTSAPSSLEGSLLAETCSSPLPPSDSSSDAPDILADLTSCLEPVQFSNNEENDVSETQFDLSTNNLESSIVPSVEPSMVSINVRRRWQVTKSQRTGRNGFHTNQNLQVLKLETVQKHVPTKDQGTLVSGSKVWTKKFKVENDEESLRPKLEAAVNQTKENKCELIIGSIAVPVRNCMTRKKQIGLGEAQHCCDPEPGKHRKNTAFVEPVISDNLHNGVNRAATKLWRPVSRNETRGSSPVQRPNHDSKDGVMLEKPDDRTASDGSCLQAFATDDEDRKSRECSTSLYEGMALPQGLQFSSVAARDFLAQRWKEAISAEHVKLVLSSEPEPPGCPQTQNDSSLLSALVSHSPESSVNVDFENQQLDAVHFSSTGRDAKPKVRTNPNKGVKIKYIPKQKVAA